MLAHAGPERLERQKDKVISKSNGWNSQMPDSKRPVSIKTTSSGRTTLRVPSTTGASASMPTSRRATKASGTT